MSINFQSAAISTSSFTGTSFIKTGGTGLNLLVDDGSTIAKTTFLTATTGQSNTLSTYVLGSNLAISNTDSVVGAFGKVQAQINNKQNLDATLTSLSSVSKVTTGLIKLTNGVASLDSSTYLTANQTITLSGDITGSGTTAITSTLKNTGTAGTYRSVTTDAQGRVTAGTNPTTLAGYGITDAASSSHTHSLVTSSVHGFMSNTDKSFLDSPSVQEKWHDLFAHGWNYTRTFETSVDNINWIAGTYSALPFSRKTSTINVITSSALKAVRWKFADIAWSTIQYISVIFSYINPAQTVDIYIESSIDNITWTNRGSKLAFIASTINAMIKINSFDGDSYLRITVVGDGSNNTISIARICGYSNRFGDQGYSEHLHMPFIWDENRKVIFDNGIQIPLGTITTNKPSIDITSTWNNSATTFSSFNLNINNTLSATLSDIVNFKINSSSVFRIYTSVANGIASNSWIRSYGNSYIDGYSVFANTSDISLSNFNTGSIQVAGGASITKQTQIGGLLTLSNATSILSITGNGSITQTGTGAWSLNGALTNSQSITALSFIKSGGTSSQFLKANGGIDSSVYITESSILTTYALGSNLALSNTDSVVGAFGKVQAQINNKQNNLDRPFYYRGEIGKIDMGSSEPLTNDFTPQIGQNGSYQVAYTGASAILLNFWAAGSTNTLQMYKSYNGHLLFRNITDGLAGNAQPWRTIYDSISLDISLFALKSDTYTRTVIDSAFANHYNKGEIDSAFSVSNATVATKADQANTYTKLESNANFAPKEQYAHTGVSTSASMDLLQLPYKTYIGTASATNNNPFGPDEWMNLVHVQHRDGGPTDGTNFGGQLAWGMNSNLGELKFRANNNGTWTGWTRVWNSSNFNPSSYALLSDVYNKTTSDSRFLPLTGGSVSGPIVYSTTVAKAQAIYNHIGANYMGFGPGSTVSNAADFKLQECDINGTFLTNYGNLTLGSLATSNGGQSLSLYPGTTNNHCYIAFYARSSTPTTRSAYIGFESSGATDIKFSNTLGNFVFDKSIMHNTSGAFQMLNPDNTGAFQVTHSTYKRGTGAGLAYWMSTTFGDGSNGANSFAWRHSTFGDVLTLQNNGNAILAGSLQALGFKTPTGSGSDFLKANGTIDSTAYVATNDARLSNDRKPIGLQVTYVTWPLVNPNNTWQNQIGYANNLSPAFAGYTDGGSYTSAYDAAYQHQIWGDFRSGQIQIRGKDNGTWQPWRTVVDSSNISTFTTAANDSRYLKYTSPQEYVASGIFNGVDTNSLTSQSFVGSVYGNSNTPFGDGNWMNIINVRHRGGAGDGNAYGGQIATGMTNNFGEMFFRAQIPGNTTSWHPWYRVWNSSNFNPTNIPSTSIDSGLGISLATGTNLNNIKLGGRYLCSPGIYSLPDIQNNGVISSLYWYLEVLSHDNANYCIQVATVYGGPYNGTSLFPTGAKYQRTCYYNGSNPEWSSWSQIGNGIGTKWTALANSGTPGLFVKIDTAGRVIFKGKYTHSATLSNNTTLSCVLPVQFRPQRQITAVWDSELANSGFLNIGTSGTINIVTVNASTMAVAMDAISYTSIEAATAF